MYATIYFATAEPSRTPTGKALFRLARRKPAMFYRWWLGAAARYLTRSRLAHCCIEHRGAVLDPQQTGSQFWPKALFLASYPTLTCSIRVATLYGIDLDQYHNIGYRPAWPTVLRFITGGRFKSRDCVQVIVALLRDGGEPVPPRITSPKQLHDWLVRRGYEHKECICKRHTRQINRSDRGSSGTNQPACR
jgi:hypothetical protein